MEAPKPKVEKIEIAFKEEWPDKERLAYEKECLGFYVSGHPLDRYVNDLSRMGLKTIARLDDISGQELREEVTVAGVIVDVRERISKGGARMAFLQFEDLTGRIEVMVFSKAFPTFEPHLKNDEPIIVTGRLVREGDDDETAQLKLRAESCRLLKDARAERTSRARIRLPAETVTIAHLKHLADLLRGVGGVAVEMIVAVAGKGEATVRLGDEWRLPVDDEVVARIERLVGAGSVAFG